MYMLLYFALQVDPSDGTYMPSVIVLSGGDSLSSMKEIVTVNIASTDRIVSLLSNMKEFLRYIEIAIKQCSRGGIDAKVHGNTLFFLM